MKRIIIFVAISLIASTSAMAERVKPSTAQKVARAVLGNNGSKSTTLTDISQDAGYANLYIFNGEQGFVVIAADDCVQPLLAFSPTGSFVIDGMPANVSGWLQGYDDEIQYAVDNNLQASPNTLRQWKALMEGNSRASKNTVVVAPLIKTTWDQNPGYNDLCPYDENAQEQIVVGCVATAMAQIMRYWEYPSHGTGSHSYTPESHPEYGLQTVNFAAATYDWVAMPLHSSSAEVAKLMYHCGVSVNMDYNLRANGGSGAYDRDIPNALTTYFNYKNTVCRVQKSSYTGDWTQMLKDELDSGRPVEYNGRGSAGGHAFICDGYGYDNNNVCYFHFNWGWSGRNDGFFLLTNLNPGSGGAGGGGYVFNDDQSAIIGIQPQDCATTAPTNFSAVADGRNALLSWNPATDAVEYSIYKDGLLIAITAATTFTDNDLPYGSYDYCVKSRDANGASSVATATIALPIEPLVSELTMTRNGSSITLDWSEPEWITPGTDDEILTYGENQVSGGYGTGSTETNLYFGHRYPVSMLSNNKVMYKVSFFAAETGNFKLFVYESAPDAERPQTQIYTQDYAATHTGKNDIVLSTPLNIDYTKDLWVFIYDPEGKSNPMGYYASAVTNGNYVSIDPQNPTTYLVTQNVLFLIRTYITDGDFVYNLYDNDTRVATGISGTSYTINTPLADNAAHIYTLKTIYRGAETKASNMAGITLGTASLTSLTMCTGDRMILTQGSTLAVDGTLSNANAVNFIIEDGAQLVSANTIPVTFKMNIAPGVWHAIASPLYSTDNNITLSSVSGLVSGTFDLLYYDETNATWKNYRDAYGNPSFNSLVRGRGYIYRSSSTTELSFTGMTNSGSIDDGQNLTTTIVSADLKGFNLIGNPYPHSIYKSVAFGTTGLCEGWYSLESDGTWLAHGDDEPIVAGQAALVKATTTTALAFSDNANAPLTAKNGTITRLAFTVQNIAESSDISDGHRDVVFAMLGGSGEGLPKMAHLADETPSISIPVEGHSYAIALLDNQTETFPLTFSSASGNYTIGLSGTVDQIGYCHLIDRITGRDIDLLGDNTYTFSAKSSDPADRFVVKLSPFADMEDMNMATANTFAHVSGNSIIINGTGTLEVYDMLGRKLFTKEVDSQLSFLNSHFPSLGVYLLRLNDKSQKIVVKN